MILFFNSESSYYAVDCPNGIPQSDIEKLNWLFGDAKYLNVQNLEGTFIGPRKEMITPWSTNAVEITQNMGITGILRIEELRISETETPEIDPMLQRVYKNPGQEIFTINIQPEPIIFIQNISEYNKKEGLALSDDEVEYLIQVGEKLGRKLTDSEVYGFAQVNSEHCRHKIFNGTFIIDGKEMPDSLFSMIKRTSKENPNEIVSAYKDNVAFIKGPVAEQFAPKSQDKADFFETREIETLISLKAETHNFPTTVEPFNGAATGSGGEIRDRLAGGKGSIPFTGSAVYMTSYPRLNENHYWEKPFAERKWLYQTPLEILIKASNGASDFGNKYGQPLINGSLFTFEHSTPNKNFGFDKVIMLAGGVGYGKSAEAQKDIPQKGDKIVVMGGDNYRIGMGGGAVSSVATGEFNNAIELNAVQRSNPEMQKRVANAIRAMVELKENPIVSIHDHGAGGHLNSLSELVEATGGKIDLSKLPVGDPTLSAKEIVGNESQERMGLIVKEKDIDLLQKVSERERAPFYVVGEVTADMHFTFEGKAGEKPIDLELAYLFGKPPKTILEDSNIKTGFEKIEWDEKDIIQYISSVLRLEGVACKDWLTNKVDRSVTGRVAKQQNAGIYHLPLNNLSVTALDYKGKDGIVNSIGHAPVPSLIDEKAGSRLAVAESLTNIVWAPLKNHLKGISLSANWMWPAKNEGENARLYNAVKALSDFVIELGINVPTGKDSLSMKQKYSDQEVFSPGTVIVSAISQTTNLKKVVEPVLQDINDSMLIYIDLSKSEFALGGSSLAQILGKVGQHVPDVYSADYFAKTFNALQELIEEEKIIAGHDISSGGMVTALLEMCFSTENIGLDIDLSSFTQEQDLVKILFSEKPSVLIQVSEVSTIAEFLEKQEIDYYVIGKLNHASALNITQHQRTISLDIAMYRDIWFETSYYFDKNQCGEKLAKTRYSNYKNQPLQYRFLNNFTGKWNPENAKRKVNAAIIREKGVNGDREMAYSLYKAGFNVKDVHMTDLMSGREDLSDVNMIVFVGGFSNSDVLGSAKGWAGGFRYNENAKNALRNFYNRKDTMSLGVCNGCQLIVELGLIYPEHEIHPKMLHNESHKFESNFITVDIEQNNSIMLQSLAGSRLGIWIAHGEGKFDLPFDEHVYSIPIKYGYNEYPANPNGSDYNAAAICSVDGRHLAMMPHLERAIFPWQWAFYPGDRKIDEVSPWLEAFENARIWIENQK